MKRYICEKRKYTERRKGPKSGAKRCRNWTRGNDEGEVPCVTRVNQIESYVEELMWKETSCTIEW